MTQQYLVRPVGPMLLASFLVLTGAVGAQEGLAASEVEEYLGSWTLSMEMQGNSVEMTLSLADVDGKVLASLTSQRSPEPTVIETISKGEDGLKLRWERDFGGQTATLEMALQLADDGLSGTFGDDGGFFSAEVAGARAGDAATAADAVAAAADVDADSDADGDGDDDGQRSRRRRRRGAEAELTLSGNKIRVAWAELEKSSADFQALESLEAGQVFEFTGGRAIKLLSEASLAFGDTVVEKGNAAEDYPGVYSVWLMKAPEGWHLVFNEHADIWGTQYSSEADAAHVVADSGTSERDEDKLKVELVGVGDTAGLLRLAWGSHEWLAPFELAE